MQNSFNQRQSKLYFFYLILLQKQMNHSECGKSQKIFNDFWYVFLNLTENKR